MMNKIKTVIEAVVGCLLTRYRGLDDAGEEETTAWKFGEINQGSAGMVIM